MQDKVQISVVIPNWNGQKLLEKNLPRIIEAVGDKTEIVVVDDGSTDQSVEFLKNHFSQVKLIVHARNLGFGSACNTGVNQAKGKYIVLLNSDVVPQKNFLKPALVHFDDPKVLAVTFNEGKYGPGKMVWKNGFLEIQPTSLSQKTVLTDWPNGGTSIFQKQIWEKLKGMDRLFLPFYFEDIDLGLRASKAGYISLFEPKARVEHQHESTINESNFSQKYIDSIKQRNHLLLTWRNLDSFGRLKEHIFYLFRRCWLSPGYLKILFLAIRRRFYYFFDQLVFRR